MHLIHHTANPMVGQRSSGFTLIEMMIVVAIIGILASIAYPSYVESVQRGDRASARSALLESQQFMERFYAANDAYNQDKASVAVALPFRLQSIPFDSPKYDLTISASTVNSYTLTATPRATSERCGNLTLTNTGVKDRSGTAATVKECWR